MFNDKVCFEIVNEKQIFCVSSESNASQKQIVIMSHGFRGSTVGPARTFVDFSRILNKNGISTLRFDQPNSGNSEGDYLESSFNQWIDTTTYFAKKYLDLGYKVALLGQSMGATATVIATSRAEIKDQISCILLWVPDPKSTFDKDPEIISEEAGQKYKNSFWKEASDFNFIKCLGQYNGRIHLVYGENDKYISQELRKLTIDLVQSKNQPIKILSGQDHSPWDFSLTQKVFKEELDFIKSSFNAV